MKNQPDRKEQLKSPSTKEPNKKFGNLKYILWVGIIVWLSSWFMPTYNGGETETFGWGAFAVTLKYGPTGLLTVLPYTNGIIIIAVLLAIFFRKVLFKITTPLGILLFICFLINLTLIGSEGNSLLIGYYLWMLSFLILTIFMVIMTRRGKVAIE